jgi:hypothetical protein
LGAAQIADIVQVTSSTATLPKASLSAAAGRGGIRRSGRCGCVKYPRLDDLAIVGQKPGGELDLRPGLAGHRELETANIDRELMIGGKAVHWPGDPAQQLRILETVDDPRVQQLGQVVAPSCVGKCRTLAPARPDQNLLRVEHDDCGRLQHGEQPGRSLVGGRKVARGAQVIDDRRHGRGAAAGHALHPGNDRVETIGIARERGRERPEIGDRVAQRLGVLRQNRVDAPKRVARRLRHAHAGGRIGGENGRLAGWPADGASPRPSSVITGTPVRP